MRRVLLLSMLVVGVGCGGTELARVPTVSQALTEPGEWLELQPLTVRHRLARDVARQSQLEAGRAGAVLFPIVLDNQLVAAPALDLRADLLQAPDAGHGVVLRFDTAPERFGEERREAFQGLSEREAAELIARSLIDLWHLEPDRPVVVQRASGAPWAAAYADGVLRLNPSFIYLASAPQP